MINFIKDCLKPADHEAIKEDREQRAKDLERYLETTITNKTLKKINKVMKNKKGEAK